MSTCPCRRCSCPSGSIGKAVESSFQGGVRGAAAAQRHRRRKRSAPAVPRAARPKFIPKTHWDQIQNAAPDGRRPGLSQYQQLVEPRKPCLSWVCGHSAPCSPRPVTRGESKSSPLQWLTLEAITSQNAGKLFFMSNTPSPSPERSRLSVDLSPVVSAHLDHISDVTGVSKAGIVTAALLDALPALLARADGLKKRHSELAQGKPRK